MILKIKVSLLIEGSEKQDHQDEISQFHRSLPNYSNCRDSPLPLCKQEIENSFK